MLSHLAIDSTLGKPGECFALVFLTELGQLGEELVESSVLVRSHEGTAVLGHRERLVAKSPAARRSRDTLYRGRPRTRSGFHRGSERRRPSVAQAVPQ